MDRSLKPTTAARILGVCAAINGAAAIGAWGSGIGGVNLGIAVATAVMALRVGRDIRGSNSDEQRK